MPYLSFAAICLLFGSNFILMDRAGLAFGPVEVGACRVAGAAIVLGLVWALFARKQAIPRAALPKVALIGALANAYPYVTQPWLLAEGKRVGGVGAAGPGVGQTTASTPPAATAKNARPESNRDAHRVRSSSRSRARAWLSRW